MLSIDLGDSILWRYEAATIEDSKSFARFG